MSEEQKEDEVLSHMLSYYKATHPLRTASIHEEVCCCKRCLMDKIEGYLKQKTNRNRMP